MAKPKENKIDNILLKEQVVDIFNLLGNSVSETQDLAIYDSISKLDSPIESKLMAVIAYARDLERDIHYSNRLTKG